MLEDKFLTSLLAVLALAAGCTGSRASAVPGDSTTREAACVNQLVIVDAGSSGTRARVFQYFDGRPESLVDLDGECENDEPLARSSAGVLAGYACARELLIDPATTPVLVHATAGMRTLAEQQPEQAERRHAEVIAALREQGVVEVESRTISGSDEALYQWIGVNHQERRLGRETATIIEFGGASIQFAFALTPEQPVPESLAAGELRTIELGGIEHRVVTRSYLHCGMNEARQALAGPSCFPSDCATTPSCAAWLRDLAPASEGSATTCEAHVARALETDATCAALRTLPPTLPNRPIRLVSALASVFEALAVVDGEHVDLARARMATARVCGSSWERLQELPGADRYRVGLCFAATHALLVLDAWGLAGDDPRPGIADIDDSWTWGVARQWLERR